MTEPRRPDPSGTPTGPAAPAGEEVRALGVGGLLGALAAVTVLLVTHGGLEQLMVTPLGSWFPRHLLLLPPLGLAVAALLVARRAGGSQDRDRATRVGVRAAKATLGLVAAVPGLYLFFVVWFILSYAAG